MLQEECAAMEPNAVSVSICKSQSEEPTIENVSLISCVVG